jgi:acid phosphatase type 7
LDKTFRQIVCVESSVEFLFTETHETIIHHNGEVITMQKRFMYLLALSLVTSACGSETAAPPASQTPPPPVAQTFTLIGAGDIASNGPGAESTAKLLDAAVASDSKTIVFTAGDNAYPNGTASDFSTYYEPTWGRHKARTRPSPGNHEYDQYGTQLEPTDYLNYFCPDPANCSFPGATKQLYYSYDLGNWHIISLNSERLSSGSGLEEQLSWLDNDLTAHLAAHPNSCILAVWHRTRFSSGTTHGGNNITRFLLEKLYAAKADVVVASHEHNYERFAKMNVGGAADANGIRHFVIGTGGREPLYPFGPPLPTSEVRLNDALGVIQFTLRDGGYDWKFVPVAGATTVGDSGSDTCNNKK